jgi:pyruvate/2-oxoglutarate dehydrogenase complex dihydrolipoamide acyltransferase (E2) component
VKHKLKIPKLGVAMDEGSIVQWHVQTGDTVEAGQVIYTLATDKAESDIESPVNGTITIIGELEEDYPVGTVVASVEA